MAVNPLFQRLALLSGEAALDALARTRVLVFGLGGVGGWCAEALVRSGIGRIGIVDSDRVCVTNINRQVQATTSTLGQSKARALEKRLREINPGCVVEAFPKVFSRETAAAFDIPGADYIIDAIDSLGHKLDLIEYCAAAGVPLYSSMGMACKLDPARLRTADIWETQGCPLARLVRAGLRKRGFTGHLMVVYSDEHISQDQSIPLACGSARCLCHLRFEGLPETASEDSPVDSPADEALVDWCSSKKVINGSAVTVTATAGMILASLVIREVCRRVSPELPPGEPPRG
ncbi:MAG: tRNA threonylcarbamoyladenosine dehydratase [Treponema sp.]|nr:tRNA threonylcarbamoyladenosine dehydratase [Treponema sp.]